jgi:ribosomal protein L22
MTPDKPSDPQKGKVSETTPEEAKASKEAAATEAEKAPAKKPAAKKKPAAAKSEKKEPAAKAKEAAAEETGVDKAAAKAAAEARAHDADVAEGDKRGGSDEPKRPKRKTAVAKAEEKAADKPKPARRRERGTEPAVVVRAHAKYVRTSARKARLVCDHIRGKDVAEARAILAFTPRAAAEAWTKLLESAIANAEHNYDLVGEDLRVTRVFADEGPTLKRFRPRAMGRATRIRKRTSHLTIELAPKER